MQHPTVQVPPCCIPFPQLKKVETKLQCILKMRVIDEVLEPVEWCVLMAPVPKKNDNVRIYVDLKHLNEAVEREKSKLPTLKHNAPELAGSSVLHSKCFQRSLAATVGS